MQLCTYCSRCNPLVAATNQSAGVTGGRPEMIETIARAGVVNHVDGLFIETHF